jgi:predicted MPP superfamily phosphohydrolase
VTVLLNDAVRLPAPFERTRIIGLDDHASGTPDATGIVVDDAVSSILLVHQPSGVLDASMHRVDLVLAGHTHGGQIVLPWGYAPITPSGALSRTYLAGRFTLPDGGTMVVSRGVGTSTIPVRWNAPADLIVITLHGADE